MRVIKNILILLGLFSSALLMQGQQYNADSLKQIWENQQQLPKERLLAANLIIRQKNKTSFDTTDLNLINKALAFSLNNGEDSLLMYFTFRKTAYYLQKTEMDSANYYMLRSLELAEQFNRLKQLPLMVNLMMIIAVNTDNSGIYNSFFYQLIDEIEQTNIEKPMLGKCYLEISVYFTYISNIPQIINWSWKALEIFQAYDNFSREKGRVYKHLGWAYEMSNNYAKSLNYKHKSLELFKQTSDSARFSWAYREICQLYNTLGNYNLSLQYIDSAINITELRNNDIQFAYCQISKAKIYINLDRKQEALQLYVNSLDILFLNNASHHWIAYVHGLIGHIYLDFEQYETALQYGQKGLEIAKGSLKETEENQYVIYRAWEGLGNDTEALKAYKSYMALKEEIENKEAMDEINRLEMENRFQQERLADSLKTEQAKVEMEMEINKQKSNRNIGFIVGGFVFLMAIGLYSRLRYIRKSKLNVEKERDRSENLLLNILPADVARELKENGKADARDFDMVSILFTDFIDFTSTSAKLSASELVTEVNYCFEAFDHIMDKYGIEKIKTIGDAYMAAGGLPVPTNDSVKNTVLAALEMQQFIFERIVEKEKIDEAAFEMRLGIHTGPVVAGIVGVKKFQYDVWGDTVNTASRIENHCKSGKVNISQPTYEFIKDDPDFQFENRGKIEVKGKGEMEMWFVTLKNIL